MLIYLLNLANRSKLDNTVSYGVYKKDLKPAVSPSQQQMNKIVARPVSQELAKCFKPLLARALDHCCKVPLFTLCAQGISVGTS